MSAPPTTSRYRDLIQHLDAIAWEMDASELRFTFVSRGAEALLGHPPEAWLAPGFWQEHVVHPRDRRRVVERVRAAAASATDDELVYRAAASDGATVWLKLSMRPVPDTQPRLLRGLMVDVTAEREATEALRRNEETFRAFTENVREVFWVFDPTFTTPVYVSPAYEELWGRPLSTLYDQPRSFEKGVHPEDLPGLRAAMRAVAEAPFGGIEYRVMRPDGTVRWASSRGYPLRDEAGRVYRVVGTTEDITERKEAQDQLAAAEAHYRVLVENAPYAIYALDADGCFLELNPAGEALLECGPGGAIGTHYSTVIAPESLDIATEGFERVISGAADHIEFDEWVVQKSGGKRLIRVSESALWQGGRIVGTHGVGRDITDEYEKDRQLRRAERMASIGTLIGGVAHELNNPLQSISGFASLLLEAHRTEEEREDLQTIRREAMRASQIVSNLRQLARQAQDECGQRASIDLNDVVRHVLRTRRYTMATRDVRLVDDLHETLPPIAGDRGELEQVVLNLVVNAEHAVDQAADKCITVRTRARGRQVSVEVTDTGRGIDPSHIERIFDPFFTTKDPGQGTGLGLSLVHGIVSEHGGTVHVSSEPGRGTCVRVSLPRGSAPDAPPAAAPPPSATRTLRVLIVDDEQAIRRVVSRYLRRHRGHVVDEAASGEEALQMVTEGDDDYDVVVSDLRMPGMDGDELLDRLRDLGTGLDRRVVFLTGDAASSAAGRLLAATGAPVLFKPIQLEQFAERVERHAEEARPEE